MIGQGQLNQNPVYFGVAVEQTDMSEEFVLGDGLGLGVKAGEKTNLLTCLYFVANVDLTCWVFAHHNHSQTWGQAFGF